MNSRLLFFSIIVWIITICCVLVARLIMKKRRSLKDLSFGLFWTIVACWFVMSAIWTTTYALDRDLFISLSNHKILYTLTPILIILSFVPLFFYFSLKITKNLKVTKVLSLFYLVLFVDLTVAVIMFPPEKLIHSEWTGYYQIPDIPLIFAIILIFIVLLAIIVDLIIRVHLIITKRITFKNKDFIITLAMFLICFPSASLFTGLMTGWEFLVVFALVLIGTLSIYIVYSGQNNQIIKNK